MSAWAKEHALSDEVRQFAGKVLDDHTKLADELRGLAVNQNATLTADLDLTEQQQRKDRAELNQHGEGPFWGLGIDGIRSVLDGLSVPEALQAHGLDAHGAPVRH